MSPRGLICLVALLGLSCTAATPVVQDPPDLSGSLSPSPSPTKARKGSAPTARFVVYSTGDQIVVYDAKKDVERVVARAQSGGLTLPRWMDAKTVSFVQEDADSAAAAVTRLDLQSRAVTQLFDVAGGIRAYGWSPDHGTVAYITMDSRGFPYLQYYSLLTQAKTSAGSLALALGREVTPDDDVRIDWSEDGTMVLVVYTPADGEQGERVPSPQSQLQVRDAGGGLVFGARHTDQPTHAVWSSNQKRVYFRTDQGARAWVAATGAIEGVPGGTRWFNPSIRGRRMAYDTGQDDPAARIRVLNLRAGSTETVGGSGRFHPLFASDRAVWAQVLERCVGSCLYPTVPTNQVVRINLRNDREATLALQRLQGADVLYR